VALTTYTELKASIADWLKRSGVSGIASTTDQIPDFITIAEKRLFNDLKVREMELQSSTSTAAGTATVALPTGYLSAKWLYIDTDPRVALEYISGEIAAKMLATASTDKPRYYSTEGSNWRLYPTPGAVYTLQYLIYKEPTALSGSTATNVIFPTYSHLYLYASLIEAFNFLEDDAQVNKYENLYKRFLKIANDSDVEDRHSGSTIRVRSDTGNP